MLFKTNRTIFFINMLSLFSAIDPNIPWYNTEWFKYTVVTVTCLGVFAALIYFNSTTPPCNPGGAEGSDLPGELVECLVKSETLATPPPVELLVELLVKPETLATSVFEDLCKGILPLDTENLSISTLITPEQFYVSATEIVRLSDSMNDFMNPKDVKRVYDMITYVATEALSNPERQSDLTRLLLEFSACYAEKVVDKF